MFVILTYDAKEKRVNRCLKICRKYLVHVQKSVFEGSITQAKLERLQQELKNVMNPKEDSCCIYIMNSTKYCRKEMFGTAAVRTDIIESHSQDK